jgi:flagellar protein FlaI
MPKRKARRFKHKKRKGGFGKYRIVPDKNLSEIIGKKPLSPSQMTKKVWDYVKSRKLAAKKSEIKPTKPKVKGMIKKPKIKKRILRTKHKPRKVLVKIKKIIKPEVIKTIPETKEVIPKPAIEKIPEVNPIEEKPKEAPKQEEMKKLIVLPEEKTEFKYYLIEPFAYADIKWDEDNKEFTYNLFEPTLTEDEESIHKKIVSGLLEVLDIELSAIKVKAEAVKYLEEKIKEILEEYEIKISKESYSKIMYYIQRNFVGLNEIEPLIHDPYIEDISCDGTGIPIFIIHRKYGSIKSNIVYDDLKRLKEFVVKLAERCGRFISYAEPLLDGTLPDGARVQATFASDVTTRGPSFTIRKFVQEPFSPIDLLNKNTINSEILAYLWLAIENGASILITGGAGTGKTTLLNALLMFVPSEAKIVSIEDTRELNLPHENWIPAVTRVGFAKGYGEVSMFDLLKEAFRQTPDYVIVGEVRGAEAYVMFQGMAAGIPAIGTMHAGRVEDVIYRLQTPPINLSPALIDTLDLVIVMVHAREKGESSRRIKDVVEIESVDSTTGKARTNTIYRWSPSEDTFEYTGISYYLQEIGAHRGVETTDLIKEIEKRKKILEWMKTNNMTNFKQVTNIFSKYHKDPEKVLKDAGIQNL